MLEKTYVRTELENSILADITSSALRGLLVIGCRNSDQTLHFTVYRQSCLEMATYLKLSGLFKANNPIDCHVVDRIEDKFRFTIIYNIQSGTSNARVQLVTKTNSLLPLISLQGIYPAYNWAEREVWDMSGLFFVKHPDLRRILTDYGFTGHPLRKDFPLSGFREVHYEDSTKHVEYDILELLQSYRVSNALNSWNGEKTR